MAFFKKPSILGMRGHKKDVPEGIWYKCPGCKDIISEIQLSNNLRICPHCSHYFILNSFERINLLFNENSKENSLPKKFKQLDADLKSADPLKFIDYKEKLKKYQKKLGMVEAVITGVAEIEKQKFVLGVMDFRFLGASMGTIVGEKITRAIEYATKNHLPVVLFCASGGARMHEGILSLMQMAKTSAALARHSETKLPYISVMTHPTTGGVTASFATLGDINIAEPGAMIGFAGPRVIKETTHQNLPPDFQTAEFMLVHGLLDMVVKRDELRYTILQLLDMLS